MLLYSCLGLLTLQIGVAVLAALYIVLACMMIIANFLGMHTSDMQITPYVLVGFFVILFLVAGIMMFMAAYHEDKRMCFNAVIMVILIFVLFLIISLISFLNIQSLTKHICAQQRHCPETLWLASFHYKSSGDDYDYKQYNANYTTTLDHEYTTTGENTTSFEKRYRNWRMEEKPQFSYRNMKTDESNTSKPDITKNDELEKSFETDIDGTEDPPDIIVSFPISDPLSPLSRVFKEGKKILRFVKRSLFPMMNVREERSPRQPDINKERYIRQDGVTDVTPTGGDMDETSGETSEESEEDTTEHYKDEDFVPKESYTFGYDFFMALIVFLIIIVFLLFTMLVLWSYKKQLGYVELFSEDPTSKHYML